MSSTYKTVVLAKRPKADIIPGETFQLKTDNPRPTAHDLKDGQVLFQSNYLSIDPAMRGWLNDTRSYIPPVQIGEVMRGHVIGTILASKDPKFPVGSHATAMAGWSELAVITTNDKTQSLEKIQVPKGGQLTDGLAVLGTKLLCTNSIFSSNPQQASPVSPLTLVFSMSAKSRRATLSSSLAPLVLPEVWSDKLPNSREPQCSAWPEVMTRFDG